MRFEIVLITLFLFAQRGASNNIDLTIEQFQLVVELQNDSLQTNTTNQERVVKKVKFKRGKAIIFTVLTGFLGGHRIYLGTHQRTPIIYSITLGGLGILPMVDLLNLIFTKDISKFENKTQIIMWAE